MGGDHAKLLSSGRRDCGEIEPSRGARQGQHRVQHGVDDAVIGAVLFETGDDVFLRTARRRPSALYASPPEPVLPANSAFSGGKAANGSGATHARWYHSRAPTLQAARSPLIIGCPHKSQYGIGISGVRVFVATLFSVYGDPSLNRVSHCYPSAPANLSAHPAIGIIVPELTAHSSSSSPGR